VPGSDTKTNFTIAVFPPRQLACSRDVASSDSDDEPLVPPSPIFKCRQFFYEKIIEVDTAGSWHKRWDKSSVLASNFFVWLDNSGLEDRRPNEANALKFWSSRFSE
jgi:hypothetical protein